MKKFAEQIFASLMYGLLARFFAELYWGCSYDATLYGIVIAVGCLLGMVHEEDSHKAKHEDE